MSLKAFVQTPAICALLKPLRPDMPRKLPIPMRILPRTRNPQVMGTAFDYLFRFEIQRRVKGIDAPPWIAEYAARRSVGISREQLDRFPSFTAAYIFCGRQERSVKFVLREAHKAEAIYRRKRKPTRADFAEIAAHTLRLAKLDIVRRHGTLPPDFHVADPSDVQELVDLLALVPFERFAHGESLRLNPTFGRSILDADADLFVGDMLVDLKTTGRNSIKADWLDQLLGYFILARQARKDDPSFPLINRLSLYLSRHAYLWTWDVTALHRNRQFRAIEQRFLDAADDCQR